MHYWRECSAEYIVEYSAKYSECIADTVCVDAGSQARLFVPRLLSVMGDSGGARAEWEAGWQGVPLQALLPWAAQMLSLLGSPEGAALLPTLKVIPS